MYFFCCCSLSLWWRWWLSSSPTRPKASSFTKICALQLPIVVCRCKNWLKKFTVEEISDGVNLMKVDLNLTERDPHIWSFELPLRLIWNEICGIQLWNSNGLPLTAIISSGAFCNMSAMRNPFHPFVQSVLSLRLVAPSLSPRLRLCHQGLFYQEFKTPDVIALSVIRQHKPLHHDK